MDLSWRLRRAAQSQTEVFAALYEKYTQGVPVPDDPEERRAALGRMILADFREGAVLDRLLRYERRIENKPNFGRDRDWAPKRDKPRLGTLSGIRGQRADP